MTKAAGSKFDTIIVLASCASVCAGLSLALTLVGVEKASSENVAVANLVLDTLDGQTLLGVHGVILAGHDTVLEVGRAAQQGVDVRPNACTVSCPGPAHHVATVVRQKVVALLFGRVLRVGV